MPLEIKELHIKVTVNQPSQGQTSGPAAGGAGKPDEEKEAIIAQCMDEFVRIEQNKKER